MSHYSRVRKYSTQVVLVCFLFIVAACAPPSITTTVLLPATSDSAARLKEVAVLPFDGPQGQDFAMEIEGALASINVAEKPYFTLVDRVKLDKVLAEMKLSGSGLLREDTIAKIGMMVGAKGIYTGVVTTSNCSDNPYRENRTKCAYYVTRRNNKGDTYQECGHWTQYQVNCIKRDAHFSFTPKLTEVETGRIVYSNNLSGHSSASWCSDGSNPLESKDQLINQAKNSALLRLRHEVAPHYANLTIKIMDDDDGIKSEDAKKKFKSGLEFARNKRLDRACELWGESLIAAPESPSVVYNVAVCTEITGRLEQSLDLYRKADRLLNKPDDKITEALKRVSGLIKKQNALKTQMATTEPSQSTAKESQYRGSSSAEEKVVENKLQAESAADTTGQGATSSSDNLVVIKSVNLRMEASAKSKIIGTLKKGEKVEKIGSTGSWINVKDSTGRTGWVSKNFVGKSN